MKEGNKLEFAEWFLFFRHALQFGVVKFCALSETNVEVAKREKSSRSLSAPKQTQKMLEN